MEMFEVRTYADVREVYERLLTPSFPKDELWDFGTLVRLWREGRADLVVAADEDGLPAAVAVGDFEPDSAVVCLVYLATHPTQRSKGYGQELVSAALARWQDKWDPRLIIGEVEHPSRASQHPDHGDPQARLRFYEKVGARVLDVPYYQPRLRLTGKRVPSMMLVVFYDAAPGSRRRVESAPIRLWLGRMMAREPRDAARQRLFAAVANEFVETYPLDAPAEQLPAHGGLTLPDDRKPILAPVKPAIAKAADVIGTQAEKAKAAVQDAPVLRRNRPSDDDSNHDEARQNDEARQSKATKVSAALTGLKRAAGRVRATTKASPKAARKQVGWRSPLPTTDGE